MEDRKILNTNDKGQEIYVEYPESISVEKFRPLIERIKINKPDLLDGLIKLKGLIGDNDFEVYINNLSDIKKFENKMIIVATRNIDKTIIEGKYLNKIKKCFNVDSIRIVLN